MEDYPSPAEGNGLENRQVCQSTQGFESLILLVIWPCSVAVNTPPCHGGDRRFKSGQGRSNGAVAQLVEQRIEAPCVGSSTLSCAIFILKTERVQDLI